MKKIVVAGKGGVGKTSLAALFVIELSQKGYDVLAIDADPNCNMNVLLGVEIPGTIADIAEEVKEAKAIPTAIAKIDYLQRRMEDILVEKEYFDFIAMGKPEGPGCYCAVNNMLRQWLDNLTKGYKYIVIDCEAGMEHLSRKTAGNFDFLVLIAEPNFVSLDSASRIRELSQKLKISYSKELLIINKVRSPLEENLKSKLSETGFKDYYLIPWCEQIATLSAEGKAFVSLNNLAIKDDIDKIIKEAFI